MKKALFFLAVCAGLISCEKDPGTGGAGTISGNVSMEVRVVLTNPATALYTVPAADLDVYIVYGEHVSPDDKVVTDYNGDFEFRNLREGKYTVYVYSRDTTGQNPPVVDPTKMVILQEVELTDNEDHAVVSDLKIYDTP
ncbi:MAG: hypothetical protein RLZZ71_315 [Bacteroidota bacterium]|jgi:hypothetical protein